MIKCIPVLRWSALILAGVSALTGCIAAVTGASILANKAAIAALSDDVKADVRGSEILKMGNWNDTFVRKDNAIFSGVKSWTCVYTPPAGGACVPEGQKPQRSTLYGCTSANGGYLYCRSDKAG